MMTNGDPWDSLKNEPVGRLMNIIPGHCLLI